MADDLNKALALTLLADFGEDIEEFFRAELAAIQLGEKYPSGIDIELYKSVKSVVTPKLEINIEMLAHWFWVVKGRRPQSEKGRNKGPKNPVWPNQVAPPFSAILKWVSQKRKFQFSRLKPSKNRQTGRIQRKGELLSFNQTAWLIRAGILFHGIKPRDFVSPAVNSAAKLWADKKAEEYFDTITDAFSARFFNQKLKKGTSIKIIR